MRIHRFQDLKPYQMALDLQQQIFLISRSFPKEETYSLTDQIRRSSRSIGANIAEAWAKRRYPLHFISKLTDSDGENSETQHWLHTAHLCGHLSESALDPLLDQSQEIGRMIGKMIIDKDRWCFQPPQSP